MSDELKKCKLCGGEPLCTTYVPKEPPWKCTHGISCKECEAQTRRYGTYAEAYEEWQEMNEIKG